MHTRVAAGSGGGLALGAAIGIVFDPLFGLPGLGLVLGSALGLVLGGGAAHLSASGSNPGHEREDRSGPDQSR
jgi:hypothetical protein